MPKQSEYHSHRIGKLWNTSLLFYQLIFVIILLLIKASESPPCLPYLTEFDWTLDATTTRFDPVRCLHPPAPEAIMKLVKCGCKKGCTGNCSCRNNKIPCTESKLQRLGFLPRNSPSFADMCGTADESLFASVLRNKYHVLAQLVPPIKETPY